MTRAAMTRAELMALYPDVFPTTPPEPPEPPKPFDIEPVSAWASRPAPPRRDWICEELALAAGRVTTLNANGGIGKTQVAVQLLVSVALNRPLFGMQVQGGAALGIFCEDEQADVERRLRATCSAAGVQLEALDNLVAKSRDGEDNVLCNFDRDLIQLTDTYWRLDATLAQLKPRLTVLDTAADMFAGDFMSTPHVRQFIKVALGGLCARHGTALLLLAHPSAAAMANGDGAGFSTAWNNSVRSRLYMRHPKTDDSESAKDRRVLEIKKSNYGPTGGTIPLLYSNGVFGLDSDPIEEGPKTLTAAKVDTRLAVATMDYFRGTAGAGQVVRFGAVFEAMQKGGHIEVGAYEQVRKPLQRTLNALAKQGMLRQTETPRGYRLEAAK